MREKRSRCLMQTISQKFEVEQFYKMWSPSKIWGTESNKGGKAPPIRWKFKTEHSATADGQKIIEGSWCGKKSGEQKRIKKGRRKNGSSWESV